MEGDALRLLAPLVQVDEAGRQVRQQAPEPVQVCHERCERRPRRRRSVEEQDGRVGRLPAGAEPTFGGVDPMPAGSGPGLGGVDLPPAGFGPVRALFSFTKRYRIQCLISFLFGSGNRSF